MPDDPVHLELEWARTSEFLQRMESPYVPLAVAAAITFHQVHGNTRAIVSRRDYDDALNIAAAALSRLIAVYALKDPREGSVAVAVDLTKAHFARGATELRSQDGVSLGELSIRRTDLLSAMSLIKRTGLPFSFATMPRGSENGAARRPDTGAEHEKRSIKKDA